MTKLEQLLQSAESLNNKLSSMCQEIAVMVQNKIDWDSDISCEYQPSDGFVIVFPSLDYANVPVSYFIENWERPSFKEDEVLCLR